VPAEAIFGLVVGAIELAKTTRDGIAAVRKQFRMRDVSGEGFERRL
jgi:hypothetical protein